MPTPKSKEWLDSLFPFKPMNPKDTMLSTTWLAKGLIMERKINILFGAEKAGKSRLLSWLLVHMLAERFLWGERTKSPQRMLYMAGEETRQEVTARLLHYQKSAGIDCDAIPWSERVVFCEAAGMRLDKPQQREWLRDELKAGGFDMLLIDPLRRVHGASESSNDEMAPIANDLREWTNRFGVTLFVIHHTGKLGLDDDEDRIATWSRGASDLPAVLDWALYAKRIESKSLKMPDRIKLMRKGRAPKEEPLALVDHGDRFTLHT